MPAFFCARSAPASCQPKEVLFGVKKSCLISVFPLVEDRCQRRIEIAHLAVHQRHVLVEAVDAQVHLVEPAGGRPQFLGAHGDRRQAGALHLCAEGQEIVPGRRHRSGRARLKTSLR